MSAIKKSGKLLTYFFLTSILLSSLFISSNASHELITNQIDTTQHNLTKSACLSKQDFSVEQWDWRDVGGDDWTTHIRDQKQDECGSCWAFGALGALESTYKIWMNTPNIDVDLSEQYILSCSSGGCGGWYLPSTLRWIKNNGIISEDCMPYQANDTIPCESKCDNWREHLFGIKDYKKLPTGNITAIKDALLTYGPLPATMEVYGDFYPEWDGGVYQYETGEFVFGHVVTIVGFDNTWGDSDEGYWICKNSWGDKWGEDGWFRIAYGECRIESSVYYFEAINYPPNKPDKPEGISQGEPNIEYSFSSSCTDPDDDNLFFKFDWGDGNQSKWLGPYDSRETVTINHSWNSKGTYLVKVKTLDSLGESFYDYGIKSEWSEPLELSMPKTRHNRQNPLNLLSEIFTDQYQLLKLMVSLLLG